ncbi:unnamed protein product [Clonostachys rosea]|uniref:SGNH hydrolase-type esterase domain-containing protein n=1 Tax=Bionectria ochroleuca TaxID=29856 RepID=A0ABY6TZ29_BIOOC|nr:unnamed protein product [Clonostachys rosea]
MMKAVYLAILTSLNLAGATPCPSHHFKWGEIKHIFIGDYRPGNLAFTPEQLLSNKIIQNFRGTSAAGPNWVEFLSGCAVENGEWLPSECSIQLWNFAYAGADYSEEFLPIHANHTTPMVNQTLQYLTYGEPAIGNKIDKSKTLVAIWIGINDVGDAAKLDVNLEEYYDAIIEAMLSQSVEWLYEASFQNFLFLNIPPRDRSPSYIGKDEQQQAAKNQARWWNERLSIRVPEFAKSHPSAKVMMYDTNTFFTKVLDEPEKYGFLNTTGLCAGANTEDVLDHPEFYGCTPLSTYFWLNSGHIHKVMAKDLEHFLRSESSAIQEHRST